MRNQLHMGVVLMLTICTGGARAQDERVVKKFEDLGAVIERDETKPNRPVIALRFGLRNPWPGTVPNFYKDHLINGLGDLERMGTGVARVRPLATDKAKGIDLSVPTATKVTDADLADLSKLDALESLDLSFGEISNDALQHVKLLKNLTTLDLRNTQIDDAGLTMLKEMPSLKHLYLTGCPVTDDGVQNLGGLDLESLCLGGLLLRKTCAGNPMRVNGVSDKGLRHLRQFKNLRSLHLTQLLGFTDDGLKELQELTHLRELTLFNNSALTDDGLNYLSGLKELQVLDLSENHKLKSDALKHLSELKRMRILLLLGNPISDEGLVHLSSLKELEILDLAGTQITDEGMKALQRFDNLRRLAMGHTKVTDKGLTQLKALKKLAQLDLKETKATGVGKKEIKDALPNLEFGAIFPAPDWIRKNADEAWRKQFPPFPLPPPIPPEKMPSFRSDESPTWGWLTRLGWLCPLLIIAAAGAAARSRKSAG